MAKTRSESLTLFINCHEIFQFAEEFLRAANIIGKTQAGLLYQSLPSAATMAPTAVNSALALELYLKCLLCISGLKYKGAHNSKELFERLPIEHQASIEKLAESYALGSPSLLRVQQENPTIIPDLKITTVLDLSGDAFVLFRYAYERTGVGPYGFIAGHVTDAVREVIMQLKTEWKSQFDQPSSNADPRLCT